MARTAGDGSLRDTMRVAVNSEFRYKVELQPKPDTEEAQRARWSLTHNYEIFDLTTEELAARLLARENITAICINEKTRRFHRAKEHFKQTEFVGSDVDNDGDGYLSFDDALVRPFVASYALMLYTTASHSDGRHKYRILFRFTHPYTDSALVERINRALIWKFSSDEACKDCSRFYFGAGENARIAVLDNRLTDEAVTELLAEFDAAHKPKELLHEVTGANSWSGYTFNSNANARSAMYAQQAIDMATRILDESRPPTPPTIKGTRHMGRLRAGYLIGGYIAGGILSEYEALSTLEPVVNRNTNNITVGWRTFTNAVNAGMSEPITFEQRERERIEYNRARQLKAADSDLYSEQGDKPQPETEKRRRLIHADELDNLPPVEWLIENEIPKRSLTVLFGPSGAGKSFVALDYALRIAQFAPVVYIAAEGVSGYAARVKAWCSHHKLSAGHLYFWPDTAQIISANGVNDLLCEIAEVEPVLVVIDTLARCMVGGDENSAKDMGLFIEGCTRIIRATSATVMPVHHTGKSAASGPRGSSALYGAADVMIELTNDEGRIQLRSEKAKDSPLFETRRLRLTPSGDSCVLTKENSLLIMLEPVSEQQRKLLEVLAAPTLKESGARFKELVSLSGLPVSTVGHSLIRLKKGGYVIQPKSRGPYQITDKGFAFLTPADKEDIRVEVSDAESISYSENSNHSKDAPMTIFEAKGNPSRSYSNNSNTPLGVGVDWSTAGAVEDEAEEEGDL